MGEGERRQVGVWGGKSPKGPSWSIGSGIRGERRVKRAMGMHNAPRWMVWRESTGDAEVGFVTPDQAGGLEASSRVGEPGTHVN